MTENPLPVGATEPQESREPAAEEATPADEGEPEPDAGTADEPEADVYDSTARQRLPVSLWGEEGRVDVTLICEPLADTTLVTFARMMAAALAAEAPEEDGDTALKLGGMNAAGCWLFDVLMSGVEGIGEEGEEVPSDWRDRLFGPLEKAELINAAVFGIEPIPTPVTKTKARPSWAASTGAVVNRFRVPFGNRMIEVSHTLRRPDSQRLAAFNAAQAQAGGADKLGGNIEEFASGYDALHVAHSGYRGAVPMLHKARAYSYHLSRATAALRKN
jgi:hypothetical protein